jgi:hypothetical protein
LDVRARLQRLGDAGHPQRGSGLDAVVFGGIRKGQGQDTEIDEVLPMDAREALGDDDLQAEITGLGTRRLTPSEGRTSPLSAPAPIVTGTTFIFVGHPY